MLCILNQKTGVHREYRSNAIESGRLEPIQFNIEPSRFKKKEYEAVLRIPCFNRGIGYFKNVKKAQEMIEQYYNAHYEELVQLKAISKIRMEFSNILKEQEGKDIHDLIAELVSEERFPLVALDKMQDTKIYLYATWELLHQTV